MTLFVLILGILPGFVWLLFYLREDTDVEPKREILYVFLGGSAITLVVLGFEYFFHNLLPLFNLRPYSPLSLFGLAGIEEFFKFAAAFLIVGRSRYFDIPIDAMIYMIVAALGFATIENIGAINGQLRESGLLSAAVGTATLRFVGATLLHTLSSALVGYYWAKGIINRSPLRYIFIGLLAGTLLHTAFNYLVLSFKAEITYPIIFLVLSAFFILNDFEKLKYPQKLAGRQSDGV